MRAIEVSRIVSAKPAVIFIAKVAGAVEHIQVKGRTKKGVLAVVVHCEAGGNFNFDITRGEEFEVFFRSVQAVAFDSAIDFRKDAMAKHEAHCHITRNW